MARSFAARSTHPNAGIAANGFIKTIGNAVVKSYDEALAFLGGEPARILASNVLVKAGLGKVSSKGQPDKPVCIHIRLYETNIITYYIPEEDREVFEADNGGFFTPTTSTRCTQFGPRGYLFGHTKKQLHANGKDTGKGVLLPVWTLSAVQQLADHKGLEAVDFLNANIISKDGLPDNASLTDVFNLLRSDDPFWLAKRVKRMETPAGKTPWLKVGLHDGKPLHVRYGDYPVKYMFQQEVIEANAEAKDYRQKWVPAQLNDKGEWVIHPELS